MQINSLPSNIGERHSTWHGKVMIIPDYTDKNAKKLPAPLKDTISSRSASTEKEAEQGEARNGGDRRARENGSTRTAKTTESDCSGRPKRKSARIALRSTRNRSSKRDRDANAKAKVDRDQKKLLATSSRYDVLANKKWKTMTNMPTVAFRDR